MARLAWLEAPWALTPRTPAVVFRGQLGSAFQPVWPPACRVVFILFLKLCFHPPAFCLHLPFL